MGRRGIYLQRFEKQKNYKCFIFKAKVMITISKLKLLHIYGMHRYIAALNTKTYLLPKYARAADDFPVPTWTPTMSMGYVFMKVEY